MLIYHQYQYQLSSVQSLSRIQLFATPCKPGFPAHHQLPEFTQTHPSSGWCHPTISSSAVPFSCLQSFPASGFFPVIQFFTSGGRSIGVSASASVLPMNIQDWSPLGWTLGWLYIPRGTDHGGEFWQNVVHWRRKWKTTSVFLPWEPHEQYEKVKRYDSERWTPQVRRCPVFYWRNNCRQNEEMDPKVKHAQLWM